MTLLHRWQVTKLRDIISAQRTQFSMGGIYLGLNLRRLRLVNELICWKGGGWVSDNFVEGPTTHLVGLPLWVPPSNSPHPQSPNPHPHARERAPALLEFVSWLTPRISWADSKLGLKFIISVRMLCVQMLYSPIYDVSGGRTTRGMEGGSSCDSEEASSWRTRESWNANLPHV